MRRFSVTIAPAAIRSRIVPILSLWLRANSTERIAGLGQPEAHISNGWVTLYHSLGQVGAARGMAVFYPNYRGSTGRGVARRRLLYPRPNF